MIIVIKAYFPGKDLDVKTLNKDVKDPNMLMTIPMIALTAVSIIIGVYPTPFISVFETIANGLF